MSYVMVVAIWLNSNSVHFVPQIISFQFSLTAVQVRLIANVVGLMVPTLGWEQHLKSAPSTLNNDHSVTLWKWPPTHTVHCNISKNLAINYTWYTSRFVTYLMDAYLRNGSIHQLKWKLPWGAYCKPCMSYCINMYTNLYLPLFKTESHRLYISCSI